MLYFPSMYDAEDTAEMFDIETAQWTVKMWLPFQ